MGDKIHPLDAIRALEDSASQKLRVEALERENAELRKERDAARQALEHDRSKVIEAVNQFSDAFARRSWLLDSRGSYEWDDDRYRDEFRGAYDELAAPIQQLKAIGKDWSNCPTNHDEIMRARTDWQTRAETAERQLAERDADLALKDAALEPFAWIGQWLFARDLPDDTPMVTIEGAGKPFVLTRGMFKTAHSALAALATKSAVKDDETVVEALIAIRDGLRSDGKIWLDKGNGGREAGPTLNDFIAAALAAKDGRHE